MCGLELEVVWSEGFNPRSQRLGLQRLKPLLHIVLRGRAITQPYRLSKNLLFFCPYFLLFFLSVKATKIASTYEKMGKSRNPESYLCSDDEKRHLHISFSPLPRPQRASAYAASCKIIALQAITDSPISGYSRFLRELR